MRALLSVAVIAALVACAYAQSSFCTSAPAVDPYKDSTCSENLLCDIEFCRCAGVAAGTNATTCLSSSTTNCTQVQTCMLQYTFCLMELEDNRTSTEAACATAGAAMHSAVLSAAAGTYVGSVLQQSCRRRVCLSMQSFRLQCSFGTNDSNVCMPPSATAGPFTTSSPQQVAERYAIRVLLKLSGSAYAALLSNPTSRALLEAALKNDIAGLLGITATYVRVLNLTVGSLIVDFAILNGSGKSAADLNAGVAKAATSSSWLSSTQSVYRTVSNETIGVLSVTVTELGGSTAAPTTVAGSTTTTGPRVPPTPSSAAATSVVAAAALALLALAL